MKYLLSFMLFTGMLFISCSFNPVITSKSAETSLELSKADVLALMHRESNLETPVEELERQVAQFLNSGSAERSAAGSAIAVTGVQKFSQTYEKGFASGTADNRSAAMELPEAEIPFYLFTLENPESESSGFALACGDNRIGNILAVVEQGDYTSDDPFMAMFRSNLDAYIRETIDVYNAVTEADIEAAEKKQEQVQRSISISNYTTYDYDTPWAPLVSSQICWDQLNPYNKAINYVVRPNNTSSVFKTGCDVTAVAQLMAYHEWPQAPGNLTYNSANASIWMYDDTTPVLIFNMGNYNYSGMKSHWNVGYASDVVKQHTATLMLHAACKLGKTYDNAYDPVPLSISHIKNGLTGMGYYALGPYRVDYNVYEPENSPSNVMYSQIIPSIDMQRPVYMSAAWQVHYDDQTWVEYGYPDNSYTAWLVDDYLIRTGASTMMYKAVYLHCNPGTGANNLGWYAGTLFGSYPGAAEYTDPDSMRAIKTTGTAGYYRYDTQCIPHIYHP